MALKTKIIVQQILNIDDTTTTASKYPKYTVVLGTSISSITASELTAAVEASAASAAAAKDSEIAAKESEINAKDSENLSANYANSSEASATQSATSATEAERQAGLSKDSADASAISASQSAASATKAAESSAAAKTSETNSLESSAAAKTSETNAKTSETNAKTSETNAAAYAAAAKTSETNAADSAASASDSKGFRDEAEAFAAQASTSALAAKNSETNTKTSEINSKASEDAAKLAQQGASDSANIATQAMTTIQGLKSDVEQLKADTQTIKEGAATEIGAAKTEAVGAIDTAKVNAIAEITPLKQAAEDAATLAGQKAVTATEQATAAAGSATTAGEQAVAASSSATRAETAANKAEQTLSISLLKDQNLADLSDKVQARINLSVDRLKQSADSSRIYDPTNRYNLVVMDTGSWGVYDDTSNVFKPLGVGQGGTGAWDAEGARNNIGALSKSGDTATAMIATQHSYPAGSTGQILGWSWRSIVEGYGIGTATADFYVNHTVGGVTYACIKPTRVAGESWEYLFSDFGEMSNIRKLIISRNTGAPGEASGSMELSYGAGRVTQYAARVDFYDGTARSVLDTYDDTRLTTLLPSAGVICRRGIGGNYQANSYSFSWENPGVDVWIDSTRIGRVTLDPTSDIDYKEQVEPWDGKSALNNINQLELVTFIFKDDIKRRVRRGIIAQQAATIDPEYTHSSEDKEGNTILSLDTNVLLLDALAAIQVLSARVSKLESLLEDKPTTLPEDPAPNQDLP
ncbi:hypothetical protein ende_41 [Salmonella phage ende]|uniref:Peptidase S74 domain-containing protein n=1 Tax=Salmonella phage ende TaxID=2713296 RepID=A0A6G8REX2_9CAUD|nr:hypothetical protein ende_41 [Salmonella phage ende]